ncbi:uncharacterized protein LOC113516733 [Galleria mellonella]|uniref:Uncharacterized protein LOC113516733 n=1 Tax=Galleria mellonella TaxID=7137 RepID=A0A6J1WVZ8_GALME|nr:uncharacterized protein LOC113516733 [Galleria mellonella]
MDNNDEQSSEKKLVNKAKSYSTQSPAMKIKNESIKRKSFYVNDAMKPLDLALCRLKKSKLVNGNSNSAHTSRVRRGAEMFMDVDSNYNFNQGIDNASLISMNFSHYELMRNLSRTNCDSDGAYSGSTCDAYLSATDTTVKNEHLEKYFRSAEIWNKNFRDGGPSSVHFKLPEK